MFRLHSSIPQWQQMFRFIHISELDLNPQDFVAWLPAGIKSKKQLLQELSEKLKFPTYFGFNWDALSDCLRDFHWLNEKQIILVHSDLPVLTDSDTKLYLELLLYAIQDWNQDPTTEHKLEIVFPKDAEEMVRRYLSQITL